MVYSEYKVNPHLHRPLTWAEEYLLTHVRERGETGFLYIDIEPVFWPEWLLRQILKPLLRVGYFIQPFKDYSKTSFFKETYKLTHDGARALGD